jgi:drug/metabolite transporter (DMT)-like permease
VPELALLLLALLWGTSFTFVKGALDTTSPWVFLTLRFGVAAAAALAVALVRRDRPGPRFVREVGILGLLLFGGFALQTEGLRLTTPARSGFLTGLAVLLVPFLSRFLFRRQVASMAWVGAALAVVGMGVLSRPFGGVVSADVRFGDLLTVGCALCFAFQIVLTSEWASRHSLSMLTLGQVVVTMLGSALLIPFAPARIGPAVTLVPVLLLTGLAMTTGAYFVQNWAQRHTTAVRVALIFSLEPVAAALFSHYYGGEPLGVPEWTGGALIVAGVVVGELGGLRRRPARREVAEAEAEAEVSIPPC